MLFNLLPTFSLTTVYVFLLSQRTNINSPWSASNGMRWRRLSQLFPWSMFRGMWLAPSRSAIRIPSRWSSKMSLSAYLWVRVCLQFSICAPLCPSDTAWCSPSSTSRFSDSSWWLQGRRSVTRVVWRTSQPTTATSVTWVLQPACVCLADSLQTQYETQ